MQGSNLEMASTKGTVAREISGSLQELGGITNSVMQLETQVTTGPVESKKLTGKQDERESEGVLRDEVVALRHLGLEERQQDLDRDVELEKRTRR